MSDLKMSSIPQMTVGKTIQRLTALYCGAVEKNVPFRCLPSVMMWGPPGVGKSQAVRQLGREIETNTGKTVTVTDVRLLLFNPIDLRGIPTANADKTLAIWLKPQIFQMDPSEDVVNILFLDEISAAPQRLKSRWISAVRLAGALELAMARSDGVHAPIFAPSSRYSAPSRLTSPPAAST